MADDWRLTPALASRLRPPALSGGLIPAASVCAGSTRIYDIPDFCAEFRRICPRWRVHCVSFLRKEPTGPD
jgi:hypothetical protein